MSDKQLIRQKFRANITASGSTGIQGGTEYPVHGEAQVRVQTSGFGATNVVEIQVKIFDGDWYTLDSVTGNADSGALDVSAWDFVRFNVTTANGIGTIVASGFFSKAQSAGGGASASFTIVQADSGTSPTATGASDVLTVTGTGGVSTSGNATTDTITVSLNINGLTEDLTPAGGTDYIVTYDASAGTNKKVLLNNIPVSGGGGSGNVVGPASSADNGLVRFDGITGKLIQDSGITVSDTRQIWAPNATYTNSMAVGRNITLNGDKSFVFGDSVSIGQWSVAMGYNLIGTTNQRVVMLGYSSAVSGTAAIAIGYAINNVAQSSISIGGSSYSNSGSSVVIGSSAYTQSANNSSHVAIGGLARVTGTNPGDIGCVSIGYDAASSGAASTAIGYRSSCTASYAFALGPTSNVSDRYGIAIGAGATVSHLGSVAIGQGAVTTDHHQLVIGGFAAGAGGFNNVYIGYGVTNTTVSDLTMRATGRSGTNLTGVNYSIYAGQGTGTGAGGSLYLGTSKPGVSGSILNGVTNYLQVSPSGVIVNPSFDSTGDFRIQGILGYTMSFWDASTGYITHYMDNVIYQDTSSVKMLELETGKRVYQGAAATAPNSANMFNGSICFYLDELGNNLKATVKYSNGTVKTFSAGLI